MSVEQVKEWFREKLGGASGAVGDAPPKSVDVSPEVEEQEFLQKLQANPPKAISAKAYAIKLQLAVELVEASVLSPFYEARLLAKALGLRYLLGPPDLKEVKALYEHATPQHRKRCLKAEKSNALVKEDIKSAKKKSPKDSRLLCTHEDCGHCR